MHFEDDDTLETLPCDDEFQPTLGEDCPVDENGIPDLEAARPFRTEYDPFDYHITTEECRLQLAFTRGQFKDLRDFIIDTVPNCRERSLAITALQDALMRTIQAIVFTHPDSVPQTD